jgi:hypothetical protein
MLIPQFLLLVDHRLVLDPTITVVGFPPHCSSELPLQAERATPYLSTIVASEDLLDTIRLGFISILIGSCLAKPLLNQTCSRQAQGPVKP